MKKRNFYSIRSQTTDAGVTVEVRIYDEIGFWGVTAKDFIQELDAAANNAASIVVAINSPGGDVFDALAIYNALRRYESKVTTRVDGVAASAASIVFLAGDTRIMPENALLMIHNPWTFAGGEADDLRQAADTMDKIRDNLVAIYVQRSGQEEAAIIDMLDAETWLTALEAQALGMADTIEEPIKLAATVHAAGLLAKFRAAPAAFLDALDEFDETDQEAPPEPKPDDPPVPPVPDDPPPPPEPANPSAMATHVFSLCRTAKVGHLAEAVIATCDLRDKTSVENRIAAAREIAGLCVAAKLSDNAATYVGEGLNVEQVRAKLFDRLTSVEQQPPISNTNRDHQPKASTASGPSATSIYAARNRVINQGARK
jgi:ATP-dependent Clp endopeptidase proteolytic subunit ClpP